MQNNNRDMAYMNGGMMGYNPPMGQNMMNPNMMNPNMAMPLPSYPNQGNMMPNDINERLSRLERSVKKLEARVNRLENPYPEATPYQNQDNNNMYMI